jgi:bis(5'-nucleosyl)-tetraphosphatase (symmetrical)
MATYAIGDIQGCYNTFQQLLERIEFNAANDKLWLVGDLINRGSGSLEVLRWLYKNRWSIVTVLGNHDLHTLAVAEGKVPPRKRDTLKALLNAPDSTMLLGWLRHQPMIHFEQGYLMVHAGLLPQWSIQQALALGAEVEAALRGPDYRTFLGKMYGNLPNRWDNNLQGMDRLRLITNAMTRLRVCSSKGEMELKFTGALADAPVNTMAWFDVPKRKSADTTIIFGHWSALGLQQTSNLFGLDTGCLWGGELTALRLEDRAMFQVPCSPQDGSLKI